VEVLKSTISRAAMKALGERKRTRKLIGLPEWNDYIQEIVQENKEAYLTFLQLNNEENQTNYKKICSSQSRD
jgi:hypothetical protein